MSVNLVTISFDGGCRPTNPGHKYGSWSITIGHSHPIDVIEQEFGWGTNNEAEFEALISALMHTRAILIKLNESASDYTVNIFTDSTIVRNRVKGLNRTNRSEPQRRMFELNAKVLSHLQHFAGHDIKWQPREFNVERFGH